MFRELLWPIAREDSNRSRERIGGDAEEIGAGLLTVISDAFRRLALSHHVSRGAESESGE
jgi:hypothetical protein